MGVAILEGIKLAGGRAINFRSIGRTTGEIGDVGDQEVFVEVLDAAGIAILGGIGKVMGQV